MCQSSGEFWTIIALLMECCMGEIRQLPPNHVSEMTRPKAHDLLFDGMFQCRNDQTAYQRQSPSQSELQRMAHGWQGLREVAQMQSGRMCCVKFVKQKYTNWEFFTAPSHFILVHITVYLQYTRQDKTYLKKKRPTYANVKARSRLVLASSLLGLYLMRQALMAPETLSGVTHYPFLFRFNPENCILYPIKPSTEHEYVGTVSPVCTMHSVKPRRMMDLGEWSYNGRGDRTLVPSCATCFWGCTR